MKYALLILLLFFLSPVYSQGILFFENKNIRPGTIKAVERPVIQTIPVKNTGNRPVIITQISPMTMQIKAEWDKRPILPGKTGEIRLIFTPTKLPENFSYDIIVYSNAENKRQELNFSGHITDNPEQPYLLYKYNLDGLRFKTTNLNLNKVYTWEKRTDTLYYYNTRKEEVSVGIHYQPPYITTTFLPGKVKPGQQGCIIITYDAPQKNDYGYHYENLILSINQSRDYKNRLGITANLIEDFSRLSPRERENAPVATFEKKEISFGELQSGEKANCDFVLTNTGKSTLFIRKTKASCGCTAITLGDQSLEAGESTTIRTTFDSTGKTGRQFKSVTIITNDPEHPETILTINGTIRQKEPGYKHKQK